MTASVSVSILRHLVRYGQQHGYFKVASLKKEYSLETSPNFDLHISTSFISK